MEVTPAPLPKPKVIYSLNESQLKRMLDDIGWQYKDTGENNIAVVLSKDDALGGTLILQFVIDVGRDVFGVASVVHPLPMVIQSKWPRALVYCNEYNQKDVIGRGLLDINEGQNEAQLMFLSILFFKDGVTEAFLQNFIFRHKEAAHEFFRLAHTEWKLY
jgi:hypothetical protein